MAFLIHYNHFFTNKIFYWEFNLKNNTFFFCQITIRIMSIRKLYDFFFQLLFFFVFEALKVFIIL